MLSTLFSVLAAAWNVLMESAVYVLFGLLVGGLLRVFLSPTAVSRHLGHGRYASVVKAALLGIPLPLCSCGVLPAAASLKKQGANKGAVTAFLISTPENGVDSLAVTYALLDPVMTLARPTAAFITATVAGLAQNLLEEPSDEARSLAPPDMNCTVDACCGGQDCSPEEHRDHHTLGQKLWAGVAYAFGELWGDLAAWFLVGLLLTGVITTLVPEDFLSRHLGGGISSMLIMAAVGIPLYICASASTPIAAALILKGVSPGAALVFLLTGPATNATSLTVMWRMLGKKATVIYLAGIAICSVTCGLLVDQVYLFLGLEPRALAGQAAEIIPAWLQLAGALTLLLLSLPPLYRRLRASLASRRAPALEGACSIPAPGQVPT
jgi:uncharacterized membrane protein YraQ (UPF0718 family)